MGAQNIHGRRAAVVLAFLFRTATGKAGGMRGLATLTGCAGLLLVYAHPAQADVFNMADGLTSLETVTVGNPGNAEDTEVMQDGTTGYGAVDYVYKIGKYEVTAGQYTEFLNAIAATDTYGLYNEAMADVSDWVRGCNIQRHGSPGSYTYSVAPDWANRPVNFVSWGDAARFCNWLHNDQPSGLQGLTTTEDGSYVLNGAVSDADLLAVAREPDATWVIPSEDEWYKAAYHYNDGLTGNYFYYPMGSDTTPDNGHPAGDTGNSANFYDFDLHYPWQYTIGGPYWRTEVGYFGLSDSPYGTFDQGGNVIEWNEAVIGVARGRRGGSFGTNYFALLSVFRGYGAPIHEYAPIGFRVAGVAPIGDLNCDGWVNNGDIDAFALALSDPVQYAADYPDCDIVLGDINGDGWVNNGDIDQFVALLVGL